MSESVILAEWLARKRAAYRVEQAAPEMLAALQGVMGILASVESNASGTGEEWDYVGPRVAAVRAAIASATGDA